MGKQRTGVYWTCSGPSAHRNKTLKHDDRYALQLPRMESIVRSLVCCSAAIACAWFKLLLPSG